MDNSFFVLSRWWNTQNNTIFYHLNAMKIKISSDTTNNYKKYF